MGHAVAMGICREIAVCYSTLVVTNSWEYNEGKSPYDDLSLDQVTTLDKAVNVAASVSQPYGGQRGEHEAQNNYWMALGTWVEKKKMVSQFPDFGPETGRIRYGRCFHCASLVALSLVKSEAFRTCGLDFEICRTSGVRHYFVVVGRRADSDINTLAGWGDDAFVVDLWQGNFGGTALTPRASDDEDGNPAVTEPAGWVYAEDAQGGHLSVVARFSAPFAGELEHLETL